MESLQSSCVFQRKFSIELKFASQEIWYHRELNLSYDEYPSASYTLPTNFDRDQRTWGGFIRGLHGMQYGFDSERLGSM